MNQPVSGERLESSSPPRRWIARLDLAFHQGRDRTVLGHSVHEGPLRVQRLFHPDATGTAHCYLLHPPGGVVLGDELTIQISMGSGRAVITTPSAGRFYSGGHFAETQSQRVALHIEDGTLEWLPQETILFSGARARLDTEIQLGEHAKLAFWDVIVLGRPACGEAFLEGFCHQRLSIRRAGRLLYHEHMRLAAGDRLSRARLGLNGASTLGIAAFTETASEELIRDWRDRENAKHCRDEFSITQRGELLIARYLGEDAQRCRAAFSRLWTALNLEAGGRAPAEPRIWYT